jgi:hypothetical protein
MCVVPVHSSLTTRGCSDRCTSRPRQEGPRTTERKEVPPPTLMKIIPILTWLNDRHSIACDAGMHDGKGVDGKLEIADRARKCLLIDLATTGSKQRGLLGNLGRRALLAGNLQIAALHASFTRSTNKSGRPFLGSYCTVPSLHDIRLNA